MINIVHIILTFDNDDQDMFESQFGQCTELEFLHDTFIMIREDLSHLIKISVAPIDTDLAWLQNGKEYYFNPDVNNTTEVIENKRILDLCSDISDFTIAMFSTITGNDLPIID